MLPKSYELIPGITVIEQGDVPVDDTCSRYIAAESRFHGGPSEPDKMPEQALRYKLARNFCWSIVGSKLDKDNKQYIFDCLVNADKTEFRTVSFDDVCKSMHWKSFEYCDNDINVKFIDNPTWYEDEPITPKTAKKRGRKAKAAAAAK